MLIEAANIMFVKLLWLDSKTIGFVDIFFQFNEKYIANICFFWQDLFAINYHPQLGSKLVQKATLSNVLS